MSVEINPVGDPEIHGAKIGTGSDFTEIEEDGTIKRNGSATTFDDMATSLIGKRLFSNTGTVDYNYIENALKFQDRGSFASANNYVSASIQYPHKAKADGKIYPHIHWEQDSNDAVVFELQYRIQGNNQPKNTAWANMVGNTTDSVFPYISGTLNQITQFKDGSGNAYIDMTGAGISATIQFRLTRTDNINTDVLATFFDFHYEIDSDGSKTEYSK